MNWQSRFHKAVTFSYDDGNEQDIRLAALFDRYNLKATFHVNTGLNRDNSTWKYGDIWVHLLNLAECPEVYRGHEVSVHGSTHQDLTALTPNALYEELSRDIDAITQIYGITPVGLSYPYGAWNESVLEQVSLLGLRYGRGTHSTHSFAPQENLLVFQPTCHHDDPEIFQLAKAFLESDSDTPQIFYIWGHSYELDGKQHWDHMERLCSMLAGRPDIFYGTNREVLLT